MARHFLEQRLYPTLQLGTTLTVARGSYDTAVHVRQGEWDGACGPHCCAMALAIMGRISSIATLCDRHNGVAGRLWKAARKQYFDGMHVADLAAMIESLGTDVIVEQHDVGHRPCLAVTLSALTKQQLVIAAWSNFHGEEHWVLCIGVEGVRVGSNFTPHSLLILDPSAAEPSALCGYNARLDFAAKPPQRPSARRQSHVPYINSDGHAYSVMLTGAVVIGEPS